MSVHRIWLPFLVSAAFCSLASAQTRVTFGDGKISFVPPAALQPLDPADAARKFPTLPAGAQVFATDRGAVSVAFGLTGQLLAPDRLSEAKTQLTHFLERAAPGLRWIARETIQFQGQPWLHFEFISRALDTDIHNHILLTSYRGHLLMFNFNATLSQYPKYETAFQESRESIRLER
jgi:hypothetical protein